MADYILSDEALRDLSDLDTFLTAREGSDRALAVIARLHRTMSSIAASPGIGRRRHELAGTPQSFAVQSWIIFYRASADRTTVEIIRVIDGRRDIETILGRGPGRHT
jgi:plasmid stabilization system protein ParE